MKKLSMILYFTIALFMLVACTDNTNEESTPDSTENSSALESTEDTTETNEGTSTSESEETDTDDASDNSSEETDNTTSENSNSNAGDTEDKETNLSQYSSQQIEYARVWLQLGPNQELEELYAQHIPAGTPLNPDDETSATYPEDVIQLAGVRLVDGSVTYSGNGDGTINVYNVPLRWDGVYPAGEEFYTDLIENTKLVTIDPGDDNKVIELINIQTIN